MMRTSITIAEYGGPEALAVRTTDLGSPGAGQIRVDQAFAGVNYIDTYHRNGLYPVELPSGIGVEASGVVAAVGRGVTGFTVGDRVAYVAPKVGAYTTQRNIDASHVVRLPDDVDLQTAAGALLKGLTAWYLLHRTHAVAPGETILVHAAAGGTGSLLVAWASSLGARVIGTAGGPEKCARAEAAGAWRCIDYQAGDWVAEVNVLTESKGVRAVYDGVGAATFEGSLQCLAPLGLMVSFGNASGAVAAVEPGLLARSGSLFLTRPSLFHYIAERADYEAGCAALFGAIADGSLPIEVTGVYPLADAARAHRDLEARKTTASIVLDCS